MRKRLEQPAELLHGHADPGIGDLELHDIATVPDHPPGGEHDLPVFRELGGVAQQVEQALAQLGLVGAHRARFGAQSTTSVLAFLLISGSITDCT